MLFSILVSLVATAAALPPPHCPAPPNPPQQGGPPHGGPPSKNASLPSSFSWTSSGILVEPKNDTRMIQGIKDPSIIFYKDHYHVFASTAKGEGYNLAYFNFTDFAQANKAPFYYLDQSAIGVGYRAAPEVFYFAPQKLWYLIYQNDNAAYSTNPDISNPAGWTAPKTFYSATPPLIAEGLITPQQGYWVDMWVICDDVNCHLFSHDDNGRLYRSQTTVKQFPAGMTDPVIAISEPRKEDLFEAVVIYSIEKTNTYLMVVECIGEGVSGGGVRYFRSWTSTDLAGTWTPLAATQENPFMGAANTEFPGGRWTTSISHGEIVRAGSVDQQLKIPRCGWRFLYQGIDPNAVADYNSLPWDLGLLTEVGGC